jgi:saccharopine dehydrogenase-like NADP-dependent oxidoreductase
MSNIIVLGAGMVGSAMAKDLLTSHDVLLTDINKSVLDSVKESHSTLSVMQLDVTNDNDLSKALKDKDLVLSAVPGFLGYNTLEKIIKLKKNVVDISFFPENALNLNQLAIDNEVTARLWSCSWYG